MSKDRQKEGKESITRSVSRFSLIMFLKRLSGKEISEFVRLVDSPFFNGNRKLSGILKELVKHHPDYSPDSINAYKLFSSVNRNKKYDDVLFRKYMSMLYLLAEEYLNVAENRKDSIRKNLNILSQMSDMNMSGLFAKKAAKLEAEIRNSGSVEYMKFLHLHTFYYLMHNHKLRYAEFYSDVSELQYSNDYLLNYFLFFNNSLHDQSMAMNLIFRNQEDRQLKETYRQFKDMDKLLADIVNEDVFRDEQERTYYRLLLNNRKLDTEDRAVEGFDYIKSVVTSGNFMLSDVMTHYYFKRLINFSLAQDIKGKAGFLKTAYELFRFAVDNGIMKIDGKQGITIKEFRNIIKLGLLYGDVNWTEQFALKYTATLSDRNKESAYSFSMASIYFYKNQFEKTLQLIDNLKYNSFEFTHEIYILKTQAFFELGYFDSALATIDSYRHNLSSSTHYSEIAKKPGLAFIKIVRKLVSLKKKVNVQKLNRLTEEVESCNMLARRSWILNKIGELRGQLQK